MKLELTTEQLDEMALFIVDNDLNQDEAIEYVTKFALECALADIQES